MKTTERSGEKIRFLTPGEILVPSPALRDEAEDQDLDALAESIARYGMLHPILVRQSLRGYELLCGLRRLRAAKRAGMSRVPCRVMELSPREASELSLVENLHRLSTTPAEEGRRAERLLRRFAYRQGELAERIGMNASDLSSRLRLMHFTPEQRQLMWEFSLDPACSEVLLHLRDPRLRSFAIEEIGRNRLSVEDAEALCLSLALYPDEFYPPLRKTSPKQTLRRFVVKDVGFFINSVDRAIVTVREAGLDVQAEKSEQDGCICYSIRIPVKG